MSVGLLCTLHDREGESLEAYLEVKGLLKDLYQDIYLTASDVTDKQMIDLLKEDGIKINIIPAEGAGNARREVVRFGLTGENSHFHYCDFDRILTWASNYPRELEEMVPIIEASNYLIIGRTIRAFQTHPMAWRETEKISNKIFSMELGKKVDITAGSCGFSRNAAEIITSYSKDKMTDAEWPMLVYRKADLEVDYIAVEGLEYCHDLNRVKREMDTSQSWLGRLRLAYLISDSAVNTR